MWRKFARRATKAGRFGWKHRSKAFGVLAAVALIYVAVYAAFVGTVGLVQGIVVVLALVGAGLAKHHENMALRRKLANEPRPSFTQQAAWARGGDAAPRYAPPPQPATVYVRSHRNDGRDVGGYTRSAPGRGQDPGTATDETGAWA